MCLEIIVGGRLQEGYSRGGEKLALDEKDFRWGNLSGGVAIRLNASADALGKSVSFSVRFGAFRARLISHFLWHGAYWLDGRR
jgi:hypothetical protein